MALWLTYPQKGKHPQVARRFLEDLSPQLAKGRPVILLRGNHDPLDLFMLMRLFVKEMADGAHGQGLAHCDFPAHLK